MTLDADTLAILERRRAESIARRATFPFATSMGDELRRHFPEARTTYAKENGREFGHKGEEGVIAVVPPIVKGAT